MSTTTAVISCNFLVQIFGDGVKRSQGKEGRRYNLVAAGLISDIVKTFLGPCGMEKIFIDILGEITITKDGAKAIIEASIAVDNEVGDGTTSVAVLTGALLKRANELLNLEVAPTVIIDGYYEALVASLEGFQNQMARQ